MARPTSRVCGVLMTGPLAPFGMRIGGVATAAIRRWRSVRRVRQVARFSRWLEAGGLSVAEVSEVRVEEFMAWQRAGG